jgi:predicted transglutaminase-like cysteine proteinase
MLAAPGALKSKSLTAIDRVSKKMSKPLTRVNDMPLLGKEGVWTDR